MTFCGVEATVVRIHFMDEGIRDGHKLVPDTMLMDFEVSLTFQSRLCGVRKTQSQGLQSYRSY